MALLFNQPRRTRMFRSAERQRQRTRRRYFVALGIAGFIAIGLTAVAVRKQIAETLVAWSIETESGNSLVVSVEEFSATRLVATGLSLGPSGPQVNRLEAHYTLGGVADGTLDLLIIEGLEATVRYDGERLSIPGIGRVPLGRDGESAGSDVGLNAIIPFERLEARSARVRFETPHGYGHISFDLAGQIDGTQIRASGQLAASFQDRDVLTAQVAYDAQAATAQVQFSGDGFETNDGALWLRPQGSLTLNQDGPQTVLSTLSPIALAWRSNTLEAPDPAASQVDTDPVLPFQTGQLTLTSLDPAGTRLLEVTRNTDDMQADVWLNASVRGDAGDAMVTIDATIAGQSLANLAASEIRTLSAEAQALRVLDATWSGQAALSTLVVEDEAANAGLALDLQWTDAEDSALRMASGALRADSLLRRAGQDIALAVKSGTLTASDVQVADGFEIIGETLITFLEEEPTQLLFRQDQTIEWSGLLSLASTEVRIGGNTGVSATLTVPNVNLSGALSETTSSDVNWAGLAFTSDYARLTQSNGSASWSPEAWQVETSAQLRRLIGETSQAAIRQLEVSAQSQGDAIELNGQLGGRGVPDVVKAEGTLLRGDTGLTGQIRLWASERAYAPDRLSASLLHDRLSPLSGQLAASATVDVTGSDMSQSFKLILDNAAWQSDTFDAVGLFGVVDLDRLWPPSSSVPQTLAVRSLNAGVPLENGAVNIAFNGAGRGQVTQAGFDFAGGRLEVEPFAFSMQPLEASAIITASGIEAEVVGVMFGVEGLSASGTLEGRLPLRIGPEGVLIESGFLRAADEGELIYRPTVPPAALSQGSASLMLDALENFQYDRLVLSVDGPVNGDLTAAVALSGKNPDLYGGYPFELNVTVDGALGQIARQGVSTFAVPDRISRDIQDALIGITP